MTDIPVIIGGESLREAISKGIDAVGTFYWSESELFQWRATLGNLPDKEAEAVLSEAAEYVGFAAKVLSCYTRCRRPYSPLGDIARLNKCEKLMSEIQDVFPEFGQWADTALRLQLSPGLRSLKEIFGQELLVKSQFEIDILLETMRFDFREAVKHIEEMPPGPPKYIETEIIYRTKVRIAAALGAAFEAILRAGASATVEGFFDNCLGFIYEALGIGGPGDNRKTIIKARAILESHSKCRQAGHCVADSFCPYCHIGFF